MRFTHLHLGLGRVLAAAGLVAGSLAFTAAGPAAADVVEPFGKRYDESPYGDFTTIGNTVMGCPTAPADLAARCATAASGQGSDDNNTFVLRNRPAPPTPGPRGGHAGSTAETGRSGERLWLLGALAVALAATGLVAKAAMRGRRD
ncbi:hypothetical protein [Streptomyces sp. NPDC002825]|uniref:hypothetical protein n=1 Tax=Streptomyces sp. NPDC002825 TaxID=3154666 RepID=UPI00332DE8FD